SYVLSDVLAAMLDAQLDKLEEIQVRRARLVSRYREELAAWTHAHQARLPPIDRERQGNDHLFYVLLRDEETRDRCLAGLRARGVMASFHYVPLHSSPYGRSLGMTGELPVTDRVARTLVRLPLHPRLSEGAVDRGRGATVSDGFRAARGDIVGYLDVDLEVHARYIPSLVRAIEKGAEVATVRRIYAFQLRSLDRYFMSRGYSYLVRKMLGTSLHDTETGYKFFRREALMPVLDEIRDPGWFWDTEFMVRAERRGLCVAEV